MRVVVDLLVLYLAGVAFVLVVLFDDVGVEMLYGSRRRARTVVLVVAALWPLLLPIVVYVVVDDVLRRL